MLHQVGYSGAAVARLPRERWGHCGVPELCTCGTQSRYALSLVMMGWQLDLMILEVFSDLVVQNLPFSMNGSQLES